MQFRELRLLVINWKGGLCLCEPGLFIISTLLFFRNLLSYIYIPVLQKELDVFKTSVWNNHRTRQQKEKELPSGVPEHIYNFPEQYGGQKCGFHITEEQLQEVADLSDVLEGTHDYLKPAFRRECERHLPSPGSIEPAEAADAYRFLKSSVDPNMLWADLIRITHLHSGLHLSGSLLHAHHAVYPKEYVSHSLSTELLVIS